MNLSTVKRTFLMALVAGSLIHCDTLTSSADEVDLRQLLHGPERCDHVISQLMRHGVNNQTPTSGLSALHPLGPIHLTASDMGDLELVSISQHAETNAGCGPAFDVVIKNCSTRDVCGSRLTLVGLLGRIRPTSPNTTVKVDSIPAGQAVQVTVTLPIESLTMGNWNHHPLSFNRLLVAIDSFDQFMESNEANNLRVFKASDIPVMAAALETVESPSVAAPTATPVDAPQAVQTPSEASVTPQATTQAKTPNQTSGTSDLQSAISQFSGSDDS